MCVATELEHAQVVIVLVEGVVVDPIAVGVDRIGCCLAPKKLVTPSSTFSWPLSTSPGYLPCTPISTPAKKPAVSPCAADDNAELLPKVQLLKERKGGRASKVLLYTTTLY